VSRRRRPRVLSGKRPALWWLAANSSTVTRSSPIIKTVGEVVKRTVASSRTPALDEATGPGGVDEPSGTSTASAPQSDSPRCPACEAIMATRVGERGPLHLVRCTACTLIYSWPQPVAAVHSKYVDELDLAEHFADWEPRKRVLYDRRLRAIGPPVNGANRLCDVGCGNGQFLTVAAAAGWAPTGIELNPPAAAHSRARGYDVYEGLLEDLDDLPWGTFDVVTSWDVLEHTPTPREFVRRVRRLVKPDGRVILTTLNVGSLAFRVFGLGWSMVCDDHFTYWNRRSLVGLADSEGLRISSCTTFGLGRDFVAKLDRRDSAHPVAETSAASTVAPRWDVNGWVIAAENVANIALNLSGTGVGISVTMTPA
jgi:2-polyprenyl-3-methyl-5-hydroxy-6-metoxy-1,4-benzoquinol methylase